MNENLELLKIDNPQELLNVEELLKLQNAIETQILDLDETIKSLKAKSESNKNSLLSAMSKYDIKSLNSESFKITRVNETVRVTLDSKAIKENHPDIYEKYSKQSVVKSYLRISAKSNKNLEVK